MNCAKQLYMFFMYLRAKSREQRRYWRKCMKEHKQECRVCGGGV